MTLAELKAWMAASTKVDQVDECPDSSGNDWSEHIYQRDGALYSISYLNGQPTEAWQPGRNPGQYTLVPVRQVRRMVETITYEQIA